jgi:hypothetical protein
MVVRLTPRTSPIFSTVMSCCSYMWRAVRSLSLVSKGGRPPTRPRAAHELGQNQYQTFALSVGVLPAAGTTITLRPYRPTRTGPS